MDADIRLVHQSAYGTSVGRLTLQGKLNETQYAAALQWAAIAQKRARALDMPSADIKSPNLEPRSPGSSPNGSSDKASRLAILRFDRLISDLRALGLTKGSIIAMRECCEGIGRSPAGFIELVGLRDALAALAILLGLTGNAPSAINASSVVRPQ